MAEARAQRRLAAILAADIVGYSRLVEADEAGTLARVKALRAELLHPKVTAYGGRIVKTTGDGTLIEFPSAVDAVQHAVEVQREMARRNAAEPDVRRIEIRMGINLGDIIIDGDDIYGDGVNVAARLEGLADPGGICISGTVHEHVRGKLDAKFDDMGTQTLKNIAQPVRAYGVRLDGSAATRTVLVRGAPRLSIIVLPFTNMSGDATQEYFADGITEDVTTDLSRIPDSFVIARNTAFTFKGKSVDAKMIGSQLGVRYVLEGSVRRSGTRVRANAQLIDTETGAHLWAERFDCDRTDLMDVQDEITGRIARALGMQLIDAESRRGLREHPANPDAVDLSMRGWAALNRPPSTKSLAEGRALFEQAISLEPNAAEALLGLAYSYARATMSGLSDNLESDLATAQALIEKVAALAPERAKVHWLRGLVLRSRHEVEQAAVAFETAIALDRNFAPAYGSLGDVMTFLGRPEETIRLNEQAMRLSPRDPELGNWQFDIGLAHLYVGNCEEAVSWLLRARESNPELPFIGMVLAASYAHLGKLELARSEIANVRKKYPWATSVAVIRARVPAAEHPKSRDQAEKYVWGGLCLAGMPAE